MKLTDILNESQLDEFIPLTKQGRMIKRAEKAGKADMKASVDKLIQNFAAHLGTQGLKFKTASTDDVIDYLKSKKIDVSDIDTNAPMTPARIKKIFQTKVQQKMLGKTAAPQAAPAASTPKQTPTKPSSKYVSTKDAALKLNSKEKRRLISQLQKSVDSTARPRKQPTIVDKNFDKSQRLSKFGKVSK